MKKMKRQQYYRGSSRDGDEEEGRSGDDRGRGGATGGWCACEQWWHCKGRSMESENFKVP